MYVAASALANDLHGFLHEDTRATTKPTLPVELILLKGCLVWTRSKWITSLLHADLTPWSRCEMDVDSIWLKCGQAFSVWATKVFLLHPTCWRVNSTFGYCNSNHVYSKALACVSLNITLIMVIALTYPSGLSTQGVHVDPTVVNTNSSSPYKLLLSCRETTPVRMWCKTCA